MGHEAALGDLAERYGDQPVEPPSLLGHALLERDVRQPLEPAQRPAHERDRRAVPQPDHRPRLVPRQLLEGCGGGGGLGHAGNATRSIDRDPVVSTLADVVPTAGAEAAALHQGDRRPRHLVDRLVRGQAGDVGQPDQRLDAADGADGDRQRRTPSVPSRPDRGSSASVNQPIARPCRSGSCAGGRVGLEGEAEHRALLRLGVDHHRHEAADRRLDPLLGVVAHVGRQHRGRLDLGVGGDEERRAGSGSSGTPWSARPRPPRRPPRPSASGPPQPPARGPRPPARCGCAASAGSARSPRTPLTSASRYLSFVMGLVSHEQSGRISHDDH